MENFGEMLKCSTEEEGEGDSTFKMIDFYTVPEWTQLFHARMQINKFDKLLLNLTLQWLSLHTIIN